MRKSGKVHSNGSLEEWAADVVRRASVRGYGGRRLTAAVPGERPEELALRLCLERLGCTVTERWRQGIPAFGVDQGGGRLTAQDERGTLLEPEQLLPLLCLIEMENGGRKVAVPDGASAAVELIAAGCGGTCLRLGQDGAAARELYASLPWLWDACFAAVRLLSRMARSGDTLEGLLAKTPRFALRKRTVLLQTDRERVLAALGAAPGAEKVGNELRLHAPNGWVHLAPLSHPQAVGIMAESPDMELAAELCDLCVGRLLRAERHVARLTEK